VAAVVGAAVAAAAVAAATAEATTARVGAAAAMMEATVADPADTLTVVQIRRVMAVALETRATIPPRTTADPAPTRIGIETPDATNCGIPAAPRGIESRHTSTTNHGISSDHP